MKKRVVIIGGGFAGLAAAHRLHRASDDLEALLLESSPRIGGKVMTHRNDMGVFEEGPNAMLTPDGALKDLIDLSGVSLIEADESAKRRYLCRAGRLVEIAPSPWRLLRGGALSLGGTLRMCCEAFVGARKCQHGNHASAQWGDESVHSFLKRRFGLEFADRFAAPMVSGVFAGDPKSLSLQSAFSKLAQLEAEHGSVIKGMKRLRAEGTPAPRLYAPRNGMQSISEAITKRGDFQVRFNSTVTGLRTSEGK